MNFLEVVGSAVAMLLSTGISYVTVRTKIRGRSLLEVLSFAPFSFPGIVIAVGLLWTYARIPFVYGTIWLLMLAYITRYLPFGLRTTSATIVQIHRDLEDASRASGAGWARTLQSVILPLIKPGFLAGWIFLSVLFLRELSTSILLYSTGSEVLAVMVYSLNEDGEHVLVAALGVMMVALTLFMSGVAMKIARVKLI